MIVDDNAANRHTICAVLDEDNYRLLEASDGPTALEMAAKVSPDLVLLDVMMPGMDGFEVCRRLRADKELSAVPVIMLTALSENSAFLAGIEAGADDFMTKPFNSVELRTRTKSITRLNRYRRLHEAQNSLKESEDSYRALFELGPIAIYSCDATGVIDKFNRRAVELWGREPASGDHYEKFCGSHKLYRTDGSFMPRADCPMAQVVRGLRANVQEEEILIERPDGTRITASVNIVSLKNERGEITGAINSFTDVTAHNAAEIAVHESEQWLRTIFEQASVGVVQTNIATGAFERINGRFCEMVGYSVEELMKLSYRDITYKDDLGLSVENNFKLGSGKISSFQQEKRYTLKDGSTVWVSLSMTSIGRPGEAKASLIGFVQDITVRKQLDEHFLQAQKMEALGQFCGGVAHDFNNILSIIGGYTELARMQLGEEAEVSAYLASVLQATGRAADLVRQILTFSRHEPQVRHAIKLQPVIVECINLMRATIPANIEFATSIDADAPAVLANSNQIHQVLMNLGINASHAMKENPGRLTISLEAFAVDAEFAATKPRLRAGDYVRVSMGDTGTGMDPGTLRRIFEPFFTTKSPGEGTGLGLSVVHGIMDGHDGAVTVHSQVGVGTVFRLYFPIVASAMTVVPENHGAPPLGNGEKILIVDDEEHLARVLQRALKSIGYDVGYTTLPIEALKKVRDDPKHYALVLTDQSMPGMSGLTLAAELQKINADLPLILMTGYSLSLTAKRVEAMGIRQLLLKPITLFSLGTAVHAVLHPVPSG